MFFKTAFELKMRHYAGGHISIQLGTFPLIAFNLIRKMLKTCTWVKNPIKLDLKLKLCRDYAARKECW